MPVDDDPVDVVVSQFVLMLVPDTAAALIASAVKPRTRDRLAGTMEEPAEVVGYRLHDDL